MTKKITKALFIAFSLLGLLTELRAQDTTLAKIPEPEFSNEPMLLNDSNYTISPIPTEFGVMTSWDGGSKAEVRYVIKTPASLLRISSGKPVKIIVNHSANGESSAVNPKDYYRIYKLRVEKKKRRSYTYAAFAGESIFDSRHNEASFLVGSIPATFKKVRGNVYLIILDNLEKGEYAIALGPKMFTFGID